MLGLLTVKDITIEASESVVCEVQAAQVADAGQAMGLQSDDQVVTQVQALQ